MTSKSYLVGLVALTAIAACAVPSGPGGGPVPQVARAGTAAAPPDAPPGTCWARQVSPAVIETVTHQRLVEPARPASGATPARPAVYRTETVQQIVEERRESWFETPCAEVMTPEFLASLQRALAARALYRGPVTGAMDARTRAALRRFQEPLGIRSDILSLQAARQLGLVAVARDRG